MISLHKIMGAIKAPIITISYDLAIKYLVEELNLKNEAELAEKLKINKAMIYYYFKDKRNLYDEVISSIIELNEEEKKEILNSSLEAKEKFKRYIKLYTKTTDFNNIESI